MPSAIKLKKSSVTGKVPLTTDLDYGELALNYADGKLFYKTSAGLIGSIGTGNAVNTTRQLFTATAGQTTFSVTYIVGQLDVYLNGIKLVVGTDVTATDGITIVLAAAAEAGDTVEAVIYGVTSIDNANLIVANITASTSATIGGNVTLNSQSDLRFADADSSNWVAFQAPATIASNITWTLPAADGTASQVLTTNGSGTLSWSTVSTPTATSGSYGTVFGNTVFYGNTSLGGLAMQGVTGTGNTAVGGLAYRAEGGSTGTNNTIIGYFSAKDLGTGSSNATLGTSAGQGLSTGSQNTLLGANAGFSGTNNLSTGTNNTIIGYNASASSATVSNEITIGNSSQTSLRLPGLGISATSASLVANGVAYLNGSKVLTTGSALTFDGTNLGVGTSSPGDKLTVAAGRIRLDQDFQIVWQNAGTNRARILGDSGNNIIFENGSGNTERFRFGPAGQLGIGGANYGTSGQVLTSNGSGSAPSWQAAGGGASVVSIATGTFQAGVNTLSISLPANWETTYSHLFFVWESYLSGSAFNDVPVIRMNNDSGFGYGMDYWNQNGVGTIGYTTRFTLPVTNNNNKAFFSMGKIVYVTGKGTSLFWEGWGDDNAASGIGLYYVTTTPATSIQFGNGGSGAQYIGTLKLYGVKV